MMDMEDENRNKLLGMSEQKLASLAVNIHYTKRTYVRA